MGNIDILKNLDSFDLQMMPGFSDAILKSPRQMEIENRGFKINKILRKQKIIYLIKNYV